MSSAAHYLLRRGLEATRGISESDGRGNSGENDGDGGIGDALPPGSVWIMVITAVIFIVGLFAVCFIQHAYLPLYYTSNGLLILSII